MGRTTVTNSNLLMEGSMLVKLSFHFVRTNHATLFKTIYIVENLWERVWSEEREEGGRVNHLWEWDFSIRVKKNSSSDSSSLFLSAFLSLGPHFCLSSTEVTYFDTGLIVQLFLSLRDSRNLILFLNHKMLFESHLQGWGKVPHLKN